MNQDIDQIKIFAIFHFVVAAITGLFACFPIFHLMIGISMLTGDSFMGGPPPTDMPFPFSLFGLMFTIIPATIILFGWAFAIAFTIIVLMRPSVKELFHYPTPVTQS